jgi:DNA repair protein RecN (Recombination protein N)
MLLALRIANFAVIEEAEVGFGTGMTVLTGETGAGKSILVDALGLLLGGRADAEVIRAGYDEASVEGLFALSPRLKLKLSELGLPELGDEVSVRRVVHRTGRGKVYVNGAMVTVGVLAQLMRGSVDIAGQHEHTSLFDPKLHGELLDRVGDCATLLQRFREDYLAVKSVDERIAALGGDEKQAAARAEFLRFQLDELESFSPDPIADTTLEDTRRRLMGVERLRRACAEAEALISAEDASALDRVGRALNTVSEAAKVDGALGELAGVLSTALAELEEAARALSRYEAGLEGDPARLAEVDERLDMLRRLCKKHGVEVRELSARQEALAQELQALENRQGHLEALCREREMALRKAEQSAEVLSVARKAAAASFAQGVQEGLALLAMGKSSFEVRVARVAELGPRGFDDVEFFFTANPGEPVRPLAKVASGGEASRVLLALKRTLAHSDDGTCYVLDEADAGVGGAVADVVGRRMKEVSAHRQVLCITHLPQVAAFADAHLLIEKALTEGRTASKVVPLQSPTERTQELARMLSGLKVTREALGAAEALVRSAQRACRKPPPPRPGRDVGGGRGEVRRTA